jgi:hypothetical protein
MNGQDMLPWTPLIRDRIRQAVEEECQRTKVAAKFLPPYPGPIPELLPADTVTLHHPLSINQNRTTDIVEIQVEFTLTDRQVTEEEKRMTAVTLATRAANLLSQAEDILIFQGQSAVDTHPLFKEGKVTVKTDGDAGKGLVNAAAEDHQKIQIDPPDQEKPKRYGEETTAAVFEAYSRLQSGTKLNQAHYGPYALVLHNEPYADTYRPLEKTLIMPADRIKPLITDGWFHGTGTLALYSWPKRLENEGPKADREPPKDDKEPPKPEKIETPGVLLSLGGNTMDLVMAQQPMTEVLQRLERSGDWLFRVYERFALRLKDPSAVIRLDFV